LYAHKTNTVLAVLFLLLSAAFDPTTRRVSDTPRGRGATAGFALAVVGMLCLPVHQSIRFFAVALWFSGLDVIAYARGRKSPGPATALGLGSVLFGVYRLAADYSLLAWYGIHHASRWTSEVVGHMVGSAIDLGPTFSDVDMAVLVLGVCLGGWLAAGRRRPRLLSGALITCGLAYITCLVVFSLVSRWGEEGSSSQGPSGTPGLWSSIGTVTAKVHPLHSMLMVPIVLSLPVGLYLTALSRLPPMSARSVARRLIPVSIAIGAAGMLCLANVQPSARRSELRVAFFQKGFLNWHTPTHERYGSRSGGMFGMLPRLIEAMGGRGELIEKMDDHTLADRDVLVIINQEGPLSAESCLAIAGFLERGGGLLVLGDHTFWKGGRQLYLNEPLADSHIRFRFDSAVYFIGGWLHSLWYGPHPLVASLGDDTNEAGCVIGASLDITYPAAPLIAGCYGFADAGNPDAAERGYLGNMRHDPNEQLGDVVLAAAEDVGKGRVVVVGDTSGFVNAILPHTWSFVERVFHWLGGNGRSAVALWRELLGLSLLLGAAAGAMILGARNRRLLAVIAGVMLLVGWGVRQAVASVCRPPPLHGDVAMLDLSHVGRHSLEGWRDNALTGLYLNLMREGFLAIGAREFDETQLCSGSLFVTVAPTKPYGGAELQSLRRFIEGGGSVLVAVGWDERSGAQALLDIGGLQLAHRPLGHGSGHTVETDLQPSFWKAWPVEGGEAMATLLDEPVVVRKAIGSGWLVVIGDAEFLMNENLEREEGAVTANVRFLGWLLQQTTKRSAR
jgi:hypothetical protein